MISKIVEYLDEIIAAGMVCTGVALVFLGRVEEGKYLISFGGGYLFGKSFPKIKASTSG